MTFIPRLIESNVRDALERGKSVLLLGPRQTGKTTLIEEKIKPDISYSFVKARDRQRYEADPTLLEKELEAHVKDFSTKPIIFIDEIQKIPRVMDIVQHIIDRKLAQFVLSGSSARKLKHGKELNLLPGRVVSLSMPPLLYQEIPDPKPTIEDILLFGTLPHIITEPNKQHKETDLYSYVTTYLEEEIRKEAVVRNIGSFSRFLEIAAGEMGMQINFSRLSQDIGVSDSTIKDYFQVLEDCLITKRIDPISDGHTKRRLVRSPKYLLCDMGIRRAAANEGLRLPHKHFGHLFEQYVGLELSYQSQIFSPQTKLRYWRDNAGPEVDYVLDTPDELIPIEVKWSDKPDSHDARHLKKFIHEYNVKQAYIICRTPRKYNISENIIALPWQSISTLF